MITRPGQSGLLRRSFLSRFSAGAAALGAALAAGAAPRAQGSTPSSSDNPRGWTPARHPEDDWLESPAAKHRLFFDTTTPDALGAAMLFASNYLTASRNSYALTDADSALIICVRHRATAFAYTDAMWAKYSAPLAERAEFVDPKSKQAPVVNVYRASGYTLPSRGVTLEALITRGVRFAVCQMATRANAGLIAEKTGAKADEVFKELAEQLVPNARLVPAGIVAVNRAQERGYSVAFAG